MGHSSSPRQAAVERATDTARSALTRTRVIAGRPVFSAPPERKPTVLDAMRILRADREATRNPWFDPASNERTLAAAFADRVLLIVCLTIGLLLLADFVAPDLAASISGALSVMVAR